MKTSSEYLKAIRPWNRKCSKHRSIRVGVSVETSRGLGIVTWRKGEKITVAVKPDKEGEVMPCYTYNYSIEDVKASAEEVPRESRLYFGAWSNIENYANGDNQSYEIARQVAIFEEYESLIKGKRTDRDVSMGEWGTAKYRRYSGTNKHGEAFDFEVNIVRPFMPCGDRILFALAADDGYIADMNGHGRIYRRRIEDRDINYGPAKYAGPQEEAE
jgi:hypothetical protein